VPSLSSSSRSASFRGITGALPLLLVLMPLQARAAVAHGGGFEDKLADVMSWVVLVVAPIVGVAVFLLVHILPEKIAEKKQHPQVKAIQCLCLLSLVFGGLLWPLAWLWAYSKPVFYKMAYGTDRVPLDHGNPLEPEPGDDPADEILRLRSRVAALEAQLAGKGKA
jgi:Protein of unknown function (DUF3302)